MEVLGSGSHAGGEREGKSHDPNRKKPLLRLRTRASKNVEEKVSEFTAVLETCGLQWGRIKVFIGLFVPHAPPSSSTDQGSHCSWGKGDLLGSSESVPSAW